MRLDGISTAGSAQLASRLSRLRQQISADPPTRIKEFLEDYGDVAAELFRGAPIPGARLQGQNLTGLDFTGADLRGADFTGALIEGARFDTARVTQAQLRKAADWRAHVAEWTLPRRPLAPLDDGDRFSIAPFAPELILLPRTLAQQAERPVGVHPEEWIALADGRLAMAMMPVTASQFSFHLAAIGRRTGWSDAEPHRAKEMTVRRARDYVAWVRGRVAANLRLPSHGLLAFIARRGRHAGDAPAAITLQSCRGAHEPVAADLECPPAQGRCNAFGLHDMFGNTLEFVDIGNADPDMSADYQPRLASVGGCFREGIEAAFDLHTHRSLHVTGREHGLRLILMLPSQEPGK